MLRAAGAPTIESELISEVRMATGTFWHSEFERVFRGQPGMFEVKLDRWLPEGWSGTADWLLWSSQYKAFVLNDLKTIKGDGIKYITYQGAKEEHRWQVSSYWHGVADMGVPLLDRFNVFYLPMDVPRDNPDIEPVMVEVEPIEREVVHNRMNERWEATKAYVNAIYVDDKWPGILPSHKHNPPEFWLNDKLAPESEREQGLRLNTTQGVFDVKLLPHWTTAYCLYPDELCSCRHQKTEKIGHYVYDFAKESFYYVPRKGYQAIVPRVQLDNKQKAKLKELKWAKST